MWFFGLFNIRFNKSCKKYWNTSYAKKNVFSYEDLITFDKVFLTALFHLKEEKRICVLNK